MWALNPPPLGEGDRDAVEGGFRPRAGSALPPSGALCAPVSPQGGEMA
jgi:hypothetical protein